MPRKGWPHCALCFRVLTSSVSSRPLNASLEATLQQRFGVKDFLSNRACKTCSNHGPPATVTGLPRSSKQSKRASNYRRNTLATLIAAVATTEGQSPDDLLETMISSHIGESLFPVLREALQHRHEDSVLAANALRLMSELPSYSHLRRPLLSYLSEGLNPSRAAQLFGVSPSAVRHALKEGFEPDTTDLFSQYPTGVTRQKLNQLEEECIVELIKTICPVKSGSKYEKYVQRLTNDQLYEQYRQFAAPLIAELKSSIAKAEKHRELRYHQQRTLTARRAAVRSAETIIQQDFCQLDLMPPVQIAKDSLQFVHNLVMVMETVTATGERRTQYIDFIADASDGSNDYHFLRAAWVYLLDNNHNLLNGISSIGVWSDGCSKQYKSKYVHAFFAALQASHPHLKLTYDFTASHHGHGKADAHGGRLSELVRKTLLESEALRKRQKTCSEADRYQDLERFRTLDDVAKFISSRVSNCTVIKLTVDRDPALKPAVQRLPMGIQKFHSFRYASRELVKTAVRSDVDEFVNQPITFITTKDEKVEDDDSDSDDEDEKVQHAQQRPGRKPTRERDDDDVDMTAMFATADAMAGLSQSQSSTTSSSSSSVEAPPAEQPRRGTRKRKASAAAIDSYASQLDQQGL